MATSTGKQLAEDVRQKIEDLKKICEGVDENTAARAPKGRWSPKEILSHLWGGEGSGLLSILKTVLNEDTPRIDIQAEDPFFSEKRARMTFAALLAQIEKEYDKTFPLHDLIEAFRFEASGAHFGKICIEQ